MKHIYISILSFTLLSSCYYDNEEALYPKVDLGCDTTQAITYTNSISLIIQENCLSCHNSPYTGGGITLNTYQEVKSNLPAIIGAIKFEQGFISMPQGASEKINPCYIKKIEMWSKNNTPQ